MIRKGIGVEDTILVLVAAVASAGTLAWLSSWGAVKGRTSSSLLGTAPSLGSSKLLVGITETLVGGFLVTIHLSLTGCLEVGLGGLVREGVGVVPVGGVGLGVGVGGVGRAGAGDTFGFVSGCGWSTAFMNGTILLRNLLFRFVTVLLPSILTK